MYRIGAKDKRYGGMVSFSKSVLVGFGAHNDLAPTNACIDRNRHKRAQS